MKLKIYGKECNFLIIDDYVGVPPEKELIDKYFEMYKNKPISTQSLKNSVAILSASLSEEELCQVK